MRERPKFRSCYAGVEGNVNSLSTLVPLAHLSNPGRCVYDCRFYHYSARFVVDELIVVIDLPKKSFV